MEHSEGYHKAIELLHRATTPSGFVASVLEHDNYRRIWTRDGVVTGIAGLMAGDSVLTEGFHRTLETIFEHQHPLGFIPSNVDINGATSYGGTAGRADNPSWAVLGLGLYTLNTHDYTLAGKYQSAVEKCLHLLDIWEYNGRHLVYVPQSGDWADEYFYHGYVLTDQLLRCWALKVAVRVYKNDQWSQKSEAILNVVQNNFWKSNGGHELYSRNLDHVMANAPSMHWFMGINPSGIYEQFDLLANSLALLTGIGADWQNHKTTSYLKNLLIQYNGMLPCFFPAVEESQVEMHAMKNNFAYHFRNYPHQFHNGGLWAVWNGFTVAALVKQHLTEVAHVLTEEIHAANARGDWNFNECLHGQTREPIGVPYCTWSAAGAVIAERALHDASLSTLML